MRELTSAVTYIHAFKAHSHLTSTSAFASSKIMEETTKQELFCAHSRRQCSHRHNVKRRKHPSRMHASHLLTREGVVLSVGGGGDGVVLFIELSKLLAITAHSSVQSPTQTLFTMLFCS